MAANRKNFIDGIGIVPNSSDTNTVKGDICLPTTDNKLRYHNGTVSDPIVSETIAATLTNKTLSGNTATNLISGSGTLTLNTSGTITAPNGTDTLAGISLSQTLTNKTIAAGSNTITGLTNTNLSGSAGITNANLANSSVTINGSSVSLGSSTTITANTTNALTIGTGLSGTSFDGSSAVTIAIDSTVVTLTGSQTLTNKTLTSPVLTTPTANTITGTAGGALTLNSPSGQNVVIQNNSTTIATATSTALSLASAKLLSLTNNSQTVSLSASATASATYTITLPAAAPTASTALVYNGSTYVWGQAGGWTTGTSTSLGAGGTISISTTAGQQVFTVASSGGNVTLAGAAFGATDPVDGASIRLIGTSDTNTVSLADSDTANGLRLKGNCTLTSGDVIEFQYIASSDRFFETSRNF